MAMSFDPFAELDRLSGALLGERSTTRFMPVDLFREGDRYVLAADLPGVDPESVDVDVDGQLLSIRAHRNAGPSTDGSWIVAERPYGTYLRQFSVGEGIDLDRIEAHYDNGVLLVVIPVSEHAKPRKIQLTTDKREPQQSLTS